jgi:hypothetical protein
MISPAISRTLITSSATRNLSQALFRSTQLRTSLPQQLPLYRKPQILSVDIPRTMSSTGKSGVASHADLNRNALFNMKGRVALVTGSWPLKLSVIIFPFKPSLLTPLPQAADPASASWPRKPWP